MIGAIFFAEPRPTSAQNVYSYQLRVFCGDSKIPTGAFWKDAPSDLNSMGVKVVCAGNCPGGTVSLADALAGLPGAVAAMFRADIAAHDANAAAGKGKPLTCLGDGKKPPPKEKCEKPTPWLDQSQDERNSKCKDHQSWKIEFDRKGFVFLTMCGSSVFVHYPKARDVLSLRSYRYDLGEYVTNRIGNTVCCDSFNASARTGSSCDPRSDLDCDGISNGTDVTEDGRFPDITTFGVGPGIPIKDTDPPPSCFYPPNPNECDCKWELMKGTRTPSSQDRRQHVLEGSWRCPSTGKEFTTQRSVYAADRCGPKAETMKSFFLVPDRQYTNGFSYSFSGSLQQDRTRVLQRTP
jgi:hypothetical protein